MKHLLGFIEVPSGCDRESLRDLVRLAYLASTFRVLKSSALRSLLPLEPESVFRTGPGVELLRGRLQAPGDRGPTVPRRSPAAKWRSSSSARAG